MAGPDFTQRATTPEMMDAEVCEFSDYRACLLDLERVNRLTLAYQPTLAWLGTLLAAGRLGSDQPAVIVDVGTGQGEMLRRIDGWARLYGIPVDLVGIDRDPRAIRAAKLATPDGARIHWITGDCYSLPETKRIDVVVSSLFAHHLDDDELIDFVRWMERRVRIGWFVNDLHRHPLPFHVFRLWSQLARWHRFVRHDGPVSIARAFVAADWVRFLDAAGVAAESAEIRWRVPFRLCVGRVVAV